MTSKQFDKKIKELFLPVLNEYGFESDASKYCTFYRKFSEDIYHFILPDLGTKGAWYDVKVFASSPKIDPLFLDEFPDDLGIPSDIHSYLSEDGVSRYQEMFNCKTNINLESSFDKSAEVTVYSNLVI